MTQIIGLELGSSECKHGKRRGEKASGADGRVVREKELWRRRQIHKRMKAPAVEIRVDKSGPDL